MDAVLIDGEREELKMLLLNSAMGSWWSRYFMSSYAKDLPFINTCSNYK